MQFKYNLPIILIVLLCSTTVLTAQTNSGNNTVNSTESITSVQNDTIPDLPYSFTDEQRGRLFLNDNKELVVIYDPQTRSELQTGQPYPSRNNKRDNLTIPYPDSV